MSGGAGQQCSFECADQHARRHSHTHTTPCLCSSCSHCGSFVGVHGVLDAAADTFTQASLAPAVAGFGFSFREHCRNESWTRTLGCLLQSGTGGKEKEGRRNQTVSSCCKWTHNKNAAGTLEGVKSQPIKDTSIKTMTFSQAAILLHLF